LNKVSYRTVPFAMQRRMVAASATIGRQRNNIHAMTEVDVTEPRRLLREHKQRTGENLSFTAFVVACLSRAIVEHPNLNAFRKGRKLILLDDVTIGVLIEREVSGEKVPEPVGIRAAQAKSLRQISDEIRAAQMSSHGECGGLSGSRWLHLIPGFLLRSFIRMASRSIGMNSRFGVVGVTAVGMFGSDALWFIPLSGATVTVTVGGIVTKSSERNVVPDMREHLCLTATFNHDIVDGAPAARFLKRFSNLLMSSDLVREATRTGFETGRQPERLQTAEAW
jgi:pyruvate/2-oxoglutarate dehydrogenase complex dihydrolipoamide acyltransferase (E2) component